MDTFPLSRPLTLDEFVKGYADGGAVGVSSPVDLDTRLPGGSDKPLMQQLYEDGLVTEREYLDWLAESSNQSAAEPDIFVEGFIPPAGMEVGQGSYDDMQKLMARLSLMPSDALSGLTATSFADPNVAASAQFRSDTRAGLGSQGSLYEEGALEAAKASAANPTQGIWSAGFQQLLAEDPTVQAEIQAKSARDLAKLAEVEADYDVMKPLSDLLKAGKFDEAFKYAEEQGVTDKLMNPESLRELRPAFTQDEMKKFFEAVPSDYAGGKYDFKPGVGVSESSDPFGTGTSMELAFPDATRAFKRKDDKTIQNLAIAGALGMLTAGLAPGLFGTAGGGATAGGATAGGAAAGSSGLGALTGVIPTGLVPGTTAAAVAAAGAPLAEVAIIASKLALSIPQAAALVGSVGLGAAQAMAGGATTPATAAAQPPASPPSDLAEVVVTGKRALDPALLALGPTSLASTNLIRGMSDVPVDIYGQPEAIETTEPTETTEQVKEEPFKDRLDEVIVTGSKYKPGLLDLATIGTGGLTAAELLKGFTEPTLRPYEELPPEGEQPVEEEVVVTGNRPPPIDLTKPALVLGGGLTAAELLKGFTQPKVDPLTGETKQPPKTEQELDKIQDALKTGATIPGTATLADRFKSLLDKYGTVENALKLLGAASGLGGTGGAGAGVGAGGEGYDPRRSAGAGAWIDWEKVKAEADAAGMNLNTYTAQNWNKIQNRALEAGAPQAVAPTTPQGYNSTDFNSPNFDMLKYLEEYQPAPMSRGGMSMGNRVKGPGDGREDLIPALLSDGEYVIDAETMALLGNGSTDAGAKAMDSFRQEIRRHKGAQLAKGGISPNAKSPLQYLKGK